MPITDPLGDIAWHAAFWAEDPNWTAPGDGNAVSQWDDGTGNGRHLKQATGSKQPIFRASELGFVNQPCIEFDGTDDWLATDAFTALTGATEVVVIAQFTATQSGTRALIHGISGSNRRVIQKSTGSWALFQGGTVRTGGSFSTGRVYHRAVFDSTDQLFVDESQVISADAGSENYTGIRLAANAGGGGDFAAVQIAFVGLKNGTLTAQERTDLFAWYESHYAAEGPLGISGIVQWLDADQISGLSDGDPVAEWPDFSGAGNGASQGTGTRQPTYKTNIQNAKPVVRFDGTSDLMDSTPGNDLQAGTTFVVAKSDVTSGIRQLYSGQSGTGNDRWFIIIDAAGRFSFNVGADAGNQPVAPADTDWHIWVLRADGDIKRGQVRGEGIKDWFDDTTSVTSNSRLGALSSGTQDFWDGDIAEVLHYDRALTNAEIVDLVEHLGTKWNVDDGVIAGSGTPTTISDLAMWLDADSIEGLSDTDPLTWWPDISGNDNNAGGAASGEPTYQTAELNSKPVVDFNGTTQFMWLPAIFDTAAGTTLVLVHYDAASGQDYALSAADVDSATGDNRARWYLLLDENGKFQGAIGPDGFENTPSWKETIASESGWHVHVLRSDGSDGQFRVACVGTRDAAKPAAKTWSRTAINAALGRFATASQHFLDGQLAEVLHYDRALTDSEIDTLLTYLEGKWGVNVCVAVGGIYVDTVAVGSGIGVG